MPVITGQGASAMVVMGGSSAGGTASATGTTAGFTGNVALEFAPGFALAFGVGSALAFEELGGGAGWMGRSASEES